MEVHDIVQETGIKTKPGLQEYTNAKMGSIKDTNGMDPTEAKDIKNRCQEYTEELYR